MSLGLADRQGDLFDDLTVLCEQRLPEGSIFGLLHRERDRLFSDQAFAELVHRCGPPVGAAVGGGHGDGVAAAGGLERRTARTAPMSRSTPP